MPAFPGARPAPPPSGRSDPGARRRRARDRRGRGLRGRIAPGVLDEQLGLGGAVPIARTRAEQFDDMVLDAVEHLEDLWGDQLAAVEFAVEPVPPAGQVVTDPAEEPVPLAALLRGRGSVPTRIVVYRRPLEARSLDRADLADLVLDVVVHQVAELLGLDPDDVDPGGGHTLDGP